MAKVPTDLSPKWWRANRAKTLRRTGFGDALEDFDRELNAFYASKSVSFEKFDVLNKLADELAEKREKAEKACLPKMHDDTKVALEKYADLILVSVRKYQARRTKYEGAINELKSAAGEALQIVKDELKKVADSIKAFAALEELAQSLKEKPDENRRQRALEWADDYKNQLDASNVLIASTSRTVDQQLKKHNLDANDLSSIKRMQDLVKNASCLVEAGKAYEKTVKMLMA